MATSFQILSAMLLQLTINWIGKNSYDFGYMGISQLSKQSALFNFILRTLSPPIFIFILALGIFKIDFITSEFLQNIWMISIYYTLINFLFALISGSFVRVSAYQFLFFISSHTLSILISYKLYEIYIIDPNKLLPSSDNFISEFWLIIMLFIYKISNKIETNNEKNLTNRFLKSYKKIHKKTYHLLTVDIKNNPLLTTLFYSIAIYENINRNFIFRYFERIFFPFLKAKTTGIMQVHSNKILSDEESIKLAQKFLLKKFQKAKKFTNNSPQILLKRDGIDFLVREYNTKRYSEQIWKIYEDLILNLPLPTSKNKKVSWLIIRATFKDKNYDSIGALNDILEACTIKPCNKNLWEKLNYFSFQREHYFFLREVLETLKKTKNKLLKQKDIPTNDLQKFIKQLDEIYQKLDILSLAECLEENSY